MDDLQLLWDGFHHIKEFFNGSVPQLYDSAVASMKGLEGSWLGLSGTVVSTFFATLIPAYIGINKLIKHKYHKYFTDPQAVWDKPTKFKQLMRHERQLKNSVPVIAVANDKGGVGKSTVVANLAAFFDEYGLRVLVIDFDAQGSLRRLLPVDNYAAMTYTAQDILGEKSGFLPFTKKVRTPEKIGQSFERTHLHAANSTFKDIEKKLQFDWLTKNIKKDIRYSLHEYLSQTHIQQDYDMILIDTPSGTSVATANALCAATHVLVPTQIDQVSSVAATDSLKSYKQLRKRLNLGFSILGVLPTFIINAADADGKIASKRETAGYQELEADLANFFRDAVSPITQQREKISMIKNCFIHRRVAFSLKEQEDAAYFKDPEVRSMFHNLGKYIVANLGKQGKIMEAKVQGNSLKKSIAMSEKVAGQKIEEFQQAA